MSIYLINRNNKDNSYGLWLFTPWSTNVFTQVSLSSGAQIDKNHRLAAIGNYILEWGPAQENGEEKLYPYKLMEFDSNSDNPLGGDTIQSGNWSSKKFWGYRKYYSSNPDEQNELNLIPMSNFVLFFVGGEGRGTYELFNFDPNFLEPNTTDPIPAPYGQQDGFPSIQAGHELIPNGNFVIDRMPDKVSYRVWNFDPQNPTPLSIPAYKEGKFNNVQAGDQMVSLGNYILCWNPETYNYKVFEFNPHWEDPFSQIVSEGSLPAEMSNSSSLFGFETNTSTPDLKETAQPGTIDYMRSKIKHVVYYMIESRSFDNVCGWLYDNDDSKLNFIGSDEPFNGASTSNYNLFGDKKIHTYLYKDGKLSKDYDIKAINQDPFHGNSDSLQQMFYNHTPGYPGRAKPDMGGFVRNNANPEVMSSFSKQQVPILNGLAENYAISDAWFSSVPGGTDINRAFSVTGSALDLLFTWEGGANYKNFPEYPRRQSIWKVLWSNGINDWKIYNAVEWQNYPFTYHLYMQGQVPSVDNHQSDYVATVDEFLSQAKAGTLPSFSFLEPAWIAKTGTTSYHPGADLIPGEIQLNKIYNALKEGPKWEETLFVITFSKCGGIYDHAVPPYATKPWVNDNVDDFEYDLMGPRVPAIFVSPWIPKNTVIRSGKEIPFDSTSFAATLLKWYGIPESRWCLGERIAEAPSFEAVFQEDQARNDAPVLYPAYDKSHPVPNK